MSIFTSPIIVALNTDGTRVTAGAKIYSYVAGTTTPTATYSDSALATPHTNPIEANSSGEWAAIYLDPDVTYKFVFTDGSDAGDDPDQEVDIYPTIDNYDVSGDNSYDVSIILSGAVGNSQEFIGHFFVRDVLFADDFAGSRARLEMAPDAETVFDVQVDDSSVGSITFASSSQSGTFVTTGGALTISDGSYLDVVAPSDANSSAGLRITFKGTEV